MHKHSQILNKGRGNNLANPGKGIIVGGGGLDWNEVNVITYVIKLKCELN